MRGMARSETLAAAVALALAVATVGVTGLPGRPAAAANMESTAAAVTVSPAAGWDTDTFTFTFTLSGFLPGEPVVVTFLPPDDAFPRPDSLSITVDNAGAGGLVLRSAAQWGPAPSGIWTMHFTGVVSDAVQVVTVDITSGGDDCPH